MDPTRNLDDAKRLARHLQRTWQLQGVDAQIWIERQSYERPGAYPVHHHYIRSNYDPMTGGNNGMQPDPQAAIFPL